MKQTIKHWEEKYTELQKEHKRVKTSLTKAWHKIDSLNEGHSIIVNKYDYERLEKDYASQSGELRAITNQLRLSLRDRQNLLTVIKILANPKSED